MYYLCCTCAAMTVLRRSSGYDATVATDAATAPPTNGSGGVCPSSMRRRTHACRGVVKNSERAGVVGFVRSPLRLTAVWCFVV